MAAPVIETQQSDDTGGSVATSLTINKPTGTVQGDLLLLIAGDDNSSVSPRGFTTISGWTEQVDDGSSNSDSQINIQTKVAGASEPSTYTLEDVSSFEIWAETYRISGVDTTTPVNVVGSTNISGFAPAGTTPAPGLTTTVDDCLVFAAFAFSGGDAHPTTVSGTGWTENIERSSGTGSSDASGGIATTTQTTAGTTADCTFDPNVTDGWVAVQIAIAPSSATATGTGTVTIITPGLLLTGAGG